MGQVRPRPFARSRFSLIMEGFESIVAKEVGGEGLDAMVAGFYKRVKEDDLIGPMYPDDDWEGSEERLRDFLRFRLLGEQEVPGGLRLTRDEHGPARPTGELLARVEARDIELGSAAVARLQLHACSLSALGRLPTLRRTLHLSAP